GGAGGGGGGGGGGRWGGGGGGDGAGEVFGGGGPGRSGVKPGKGAPPQTRPPPPAPSVRPSHIGSWRGPQVEVRGAERRAGRGTWPKVMDDDDACATVRGRMGPLAGGDGVRAARAVRVARPDALPAFCGEARARRPRP